MSATLHQHLAALVSSWRTGAWTHEYSALSEILRWAESPEGSGFILRPPQLRALETYWYLRLVKGTPRTLDLYRDLFPKTAELLRALGIADEPFRECDFDLAALWERIRSDDDFIRRHRFESLRESLTLDYPSYILALAMGAGKTALIGAIIATEFALAQEYPEGPFVKNALVFAPGKTIIESLRELAELPYDRILPPRFYKPFAASVKLTFTRDGEKDIPVIRGSEFNVVVTNTEKIRIQKETIRKSDIGSLLASAAKEDEARAEVANLRLQKIASLPHLAVFSDEAHHTYGQALDAELKKVRKTVDYLARETNVLCVVNTTGTPYFRRQPLRDVVIWYGLSEGIREGILKDVAGNIHAYSFDDANADQFVAHVVEDFFRDYRDTFLPNGAPAKIALYFPQTDDLEELRPIIEAKVVECGLSPEIILRNTNASTQAEVDAFNRLNDPASPHRVILLVNKGTEGWNCPSLFSCALARRLRSSNNFVLQAASRCLRQVPGNTMPARIYLSMDNRATLDRELQETYGESIADLDRLAVTRRQTVIRLRKIKIPPLLVKRIVRRVVPRDIASPDITLRKPNARAEALKKVSFTVAAQATARSVLQQIGDTVEIATAPDSLDAYAVAVELAAIFRLDPGAVCGEIRRLYGTADVPEAHLPGLSRQIEEQTRNYEVREEAVETALALVKPDGFRRETTPEGVETYTAEISYPVDRERLLISLGSLPTGTSGDFGFHYEPYNFDSGPEVSFFQEMLSYLNLHPEQIEDIYFTGALTNPRQTDFFVDYKGEDNDWHRYTPDFVIRRKDGRCLIVEIKDARWEATTREDLTRSGEGKPALTVEGRKAIAVKKWEDLNPDRLKYELIFARETTIPYNDLKPARVFVSPPLAKGDQGGFPGNLDRGASPIAHVRKKGPRKGARS
ncbi:MAG: DEAD/DEAH box helicase family protein [Candidatus Geothermincolia bacterium]